MKPYKIMFICGESSGDLLASELMIGLNNTGQNFEFSGIFGASCEEYLQKKSLVPLSDIAVMGITEIIPALFKIRNAMTNAVQYIADNDIDMLICVDAFAFTHPIAVTASTYYPHLKIVKYVAPKLWAWGNYRAKKLQNIYDLILCNLPFEVNFFAGYGIKSEYVGHSVTKRIPIVSQNELQTFAKNQNFNPNKQNILLLAGSRTSEIIRLMPVWLEFTKHYDENFIVPVADNMMDFMQNNFADIFHQKNIFIILPSQRFHAFLSADFALAASGTVSLELMMCDVPAIIGYKMSAVTAWIAKKLIQVKYVSLLNIILDKYILPEYLQENCHFNAIQADFEALLGKKSLYDVQKNAYIQGIKTISVYDKNGDVMDTADTASKYILNIK